MCVMKRHVRGTQNQSECDFKISLYVYKRVNGKFICPIHNYVLAGNLLFIPVKLYCYILVITQGLNMPIRLLFPYVLISITLHIKYNYLQVVLAMKTFSLSICRKTVLWLSAPYCPSSLRSSSRL